MKKAVRTLALAAVVFGTVGVSLASVGGTSPTPRPPQPTPPAAMVAVHVVLSFFGL